MPRYTHSTVCYIYTSMLAYMYFKDRRNQILVVTVYESKHLKCIYINLKSLFFFLQLAYCIVQFLEKDPTLTEPVSVPCHYYLPHSSSSPILFRLVPRIFTSLPLIVFCFQVIRGLLKFWPKTCSQKEVMSSFYEIPSCQPFFSVFIFFFVTCS